MASNGASPSRQVEVGTPGAGMTRITRAFRPEDMLWLALFSAIAVFSPERDWIELALLVALGMAQIAERWIGARWSVVLRLVLCYPLLGLGGGISSSFYILLILPVIGASTNFGWIGTSLTTGVACAEYLSSLLFINFEESYIDEQGAREIALRVLFFPVVAFLVYQVAKAKRLAEAELRRSERLAALGQLTAGLAHELRNPLGSIRTSAELLRRNVPDSNEIAVEMSGNIVEEVDRTNSLVTRFLEFAKPQSLRAKQEDVEAFLDGVVARFVYSEKRVVVEKNYELALPKVAFDAEWLERVVVNLLNNAAQASPEGSTVTLGARSVDHGVEISVTDRGTGIEKKNLENIFNPFFTTKSTGTGLGLAIVSKIVGEHGGRVAVESEPGQGTTVRVWLPQ